MTIEGRVEHGDERGRILGYPTANIPIETECTASNGVYAARVRIGGKYRDTGDGDSGEGAGMGTVADTDRCAGDAGIRFDAMANLGVKPTFSKDSSSKGSGRRVLEVHLFGFEGDLYGQTIETELVEFIRPERRFADLDELRTQIEKDEQQIKKILKCT